jgi:hypothetical protein
MSKEPSVELTAVDAAGKEFLCRVHVLPLPGGQPETMAMLIMQDLRGEGHGVP